MLRHRRLTDRAMPSRSSLAFMPPTASFSNTPRRVGSANALKMSLSMRTDKHRRASGLRFHAQRKERPP